MNGYGGGVFRPDRILSRAQFTQILYNMEDRPTVNDRCPFSDVADSAWCAGTVTWANQNGVVSAHFIFLSIILFTVIPYDRFK